MFGSKYQSVGLYKIRGGPSSESADFADARQAGWRVTDGRKLALRTQVGWGSRLGFPRGGRIFDQDRGGQAAKPLLSRADRAITVGVACSLRAGWRNRHRQGFRAGLRFAAAPPTSGRIAGEAFVSGNPSIYRVLRPA